MRMSDCETVDEILSEFAKRDPAGYVVWGQKLLAAHNRECEQLNTEIEAMCKFNDALNAQMKERAAECEKLKFDNMHLKSCQRTSGEVIIEQAYKVEAKDAEIANLRAALKPVLECDCWILETAKSHATYGAADAIKAVNEAQRIYKKVKK